jgi:type IV secretory pathway VirB2 component (pilin)
MNKTGRRMLPNTAVITVAALACAALAHAQAQQGFGSDTSGVGTALTNLINWISKIIGGAMIVLGMVLTGVKMSMNDSNALKQGGMVIAGGLLIFMAWNILKLIAGFAGFAF